LAALGGRAGNINAWLKHMKREQNLGAMQGLMVHGNAKYYIQL
jgi:hypothetical protein